MRNIEKELYQVLELHLRKKNIDQIRVAEIIKEAKISKATFYRHYHDKYDLLNHSFYSVFMKDAIESFLTDLSWEQMLDRCFTYWKDNLPILKNALSSTEKGSLRDYFFQVGSHIWLALLRKKEIEKIDEEILELIDFYTAGSVAIQVKWVEQGYKKSNEEMIHILSEAIPLKLKKFLIF